MGNGRTAAAMWVREASRELLTLAALATALSVVSIGVRTDELPWIADPTSEGASCELAAAQDGEAAQDGLSAAAGVERISFADALARVGDASVTFVDARDAGMFEAGHIPGAISIPTGEAEGLLTVQSLPLPVDKLVICYCEGWSCEQSERLGTLLRDTVGCQRVRVLAGGWARWVEREGPVAFGRTSDHG